MKPTRWFLLCLIATIAIARPAWTCSFAESEDVFIQQQDPDHPYAKFAAGRLGLLHGAYRIRHLVVAYNTLSGRPLTPAEQQAAESVDRFYNADTYPDARSQADATLPGLHAWLAATAIQPGDLEHKVPGDDYQTFTNCLDDAFKTAALTYADRQKRGNPAAAANWLQGQQVVFANCAGPAQAPAPVPPSAPLWLKQDRAYQLAAAQFYATQYDQAIAGFRAIAADSASPWARISRYLVARAMIRRATVPYKSEESPAASDKNAATTRAHLAEARTELQALAKDPAYATAAGHLLDFVQTRLDPEAQAAELARRLARPGSAAEYRQNVIDLTVLYHSLPQYAPTSAGPHPVRTGLLRWIDDAFLTGSSYTDGRGLNQLYAVASTNSAADAFATWQKSRTAQWLVVALMRAQPGSVGTAELIAAARNLPPSSPAYATATYHRLRLQQGKGVYEELQTIVPALESTQPRSTINAFQDLRSDHSPTLSAWLENATRLPASFGDEDGGEGQPLPTLDKNHAVALCGVNLYAADTRHLDEDTALILNQRMPLRLLREAALGTSLPGNVRFQLAHMAWTRALLLNDSETALALGPYLSGCQPAFKPWVDAYAAASTPDDRHAAGLLALMRFTSTEVTVRTGIERDFASYSEFRDNWWCGADPGAKGDPTFFTQPIIARGVRPDPPFLTPADRTAIDAERKQLSQTPVAADYFARRSLAWVQAHPTDPRNPDLLGFAERVMRNGCRTDASKALNHQLFDTVHRRYPQSEWAKKYTTWE